MRKNPLGVAKIAPLSTYRVKMTFLQVNMTFFEKKFRKSVNCCQMATMANKGYKSYIFPNFIFKLFHKDQSYCIGNGFKKEIFAQL